MRGKDYYILVATSENTYSEISEQLHSLGFIEFKDYIYYKWIDKKMVLSSGNCHMIIVRDYLASSSEFMKEYAIYPYPLLIKQEKKHVDERIFGYFDLWIHEDIRVDNTFGYEASDQYIRGHLREGIREIIIPHLYGLGNGFWPGITVGNRLNSPISNGKDKSGMCFFADNVIDSCVEKGKSVTEIISYCHSDEIFDEKYILENFNMYLDKIRKRDKDWDIKIYDFIVQNYQKAKLFYDGGHPTNVVIKKICVDILYNLGIEDKGISTKQKLDRNEMPIYPMVRKVLGLKWEAQFIRCGRAGRKASDSMDFDEYIREYLWWCYGIIE